MVKLSFKVERKHWREFIIAAGRRAGFVGGLIYTIGFTLLAVLATEFFKRCQQCEIDDQSYFTGTFVTLCIWSAWTYLFHRLFTPKYVKDVGVILGDRKLAVTEQGVEASGLYDKVAYAWEAIEGITSHKAIVIIWTEPASGIFIPRTAFAPPDDELTFKQLVEQRIASARPAK